jgi:ketosteroid isomerase-like protein
MLTHMLRHCSLRSASMHRLLMAAMLLSVAACKPITAFAVHHPHQKRATKETVEALEQQWRQAQLNGDVTAMDRLLSDDFVGITAFGQVTTKAQQLARIRDRVVVLTQLDLSDIKVKLIGPIVAVVTSRAEVKGTNEGAPISGTFRYTRVYQRLASGAWKITSFESTRVPAEGSGRGRTEADASQTPRH